MILERRQGLLLRAISQLVWRIPGRPAAKMAGFSHTEYGSGLDMLCAAQETPDGELRARFYQHALDELKHARLFKERARALSPARSRAQAVLDDADFIHSHGIRSSESLYQQLGELEFLAFVWIHELNGARQFDVYAELMRDDTASAQMFETIAHDERFHIAYSRRELDKLAKAGQARTVQRAVIQVRLRALYQAWLRFGRWLGNLMASLWLGLVYVLIVGPFSLAGRLAEAPSAGFVPPDPRLTDPVGQALEQG